MQWFSIVRNVQPCLPVFRVLRIAQRIAGSVVDCPSDGHESDQECKQHGANQHERDVPKGKGERYLDIDHIPDGPAEEA